MEITALSTNCQITVRYSTTIHIHTPRTTLNFTQQLPEATMPQTGYTKLNALYSIPHP